MDEDTATQLHNIRENLHQIQGHALAVLLAVQALASTHPNRPAALVEFVRLAKEADAHMDGAKELPDAGRLIKYFDSAYTGLVASFRQAG